MNKNYIKNIIIENFYLLSSFMQCFIKYQYLIFFDGVKGMLWKNIFFSHVQEVIRQFMLKFGYPSSIR